MQEMVKQVVPSIINYNKDTITIIIASAAFILSIWNAWRSRYDALRVARNQLTEILMKISETRSNRNDNFDTPSDSVEILAKKRKARGAFSDRLRFLCNQAEFLFDQMPKRINPIEFALVGLAYDDIDELIASEIWVKKSLKAAKTPKSKAHAHRTLARLFFKTQKLVEGRAAFEAAISCLLEKKNDEYRSDLVETYIRWVDLEILYGNPFHVHNLRDRALCVVDDIQLPNRKNHELRRVTQITVSHGKNCSPSHVEDIKKES